MNSSYRNYCRLHASQHIQNKPAFPVNEALRGEQAGWCSILLEPFSAILEHRNQNHKRSHREYDWSMGHQLTHQDRCLHLAVFPGIICSVSQEPQLTLFGYEPAGEFSIPVVKHMGISNIINTCCFLLRKSFVFTTTSGFIKSSTVGS